MNNQPNRKTYGSVYPKATTFMGKMKENGWIIGAIVVLCFINGLGCILYYFGSDITPFDTLWTILGTFLLYTAKFIMNRDTLSVRFSIVSICAIFCLTAYLFFNGINTFNYLMTEMILFPQIIAYLLISKRAKWLFQKQPPKY